MKQSAKNKADKGHQGRRLFLGGLLSTAMLAGGRRSEAGIFTSPVATNHLRPPGAVREDIFPGTCIRCGRCVEVCPYHCIIPLDSRFGVYSGTPLIFTEKNPCYLCMKCVEVCPTGTLRPVRQEETRMGQAIVNRHLCATWLGQALCRTCYNVCPFKDKAIYLDELRPIVDEKYCTGCGLCVHGCMIMAENGLKAINVEPLYSLGKKS
jgi:MauM/NapG family ferredoxin protein